MYPVSEISYAQANYLDAINQPAYRTTGSSPVKFYTYQDIAPMFFATGQYVNKTISAAENAGTLPISPIKPNRPMFPR